jgi:hypothetical protein
VRIIGVLAPTDTLLDDSHILNWRGFEPLEMEQSLLIESNASNELKLFYLYDALNIPVKLQQQLYSVFYIANDEYVPMYIGFDEARMMRREKLFRGLDDHIVGVFQEDVIVVGISKKTYTLFDMMHFVPRNRREK